MNHLLYYCESHYVVSRLKFILLIILSLIVSVTHAASLDAMLIDAMKTYKVPVVSYAIIDDHHIVKRRAVSIDPAYTVSPHTLFQAASISKSLTTVAALILLDKNELALNKKANDYLKTWKIHQNKFTKQQPVLIKHLMSMTSGLSVSGFAGYERQKKLPTNIEILNGTGPANNIPVRVKTVPGMTYFYSGGAFQVLEQIITEVTKNKFNDFMNKTVLLPMDMTDSIYQYPLTESRYLKRVVPGFLGWSGQKVKGGWHNYACAGACGLWSTPTDIAKFMLNISKSYQGKDPGLLSQSTTKKMLTRQKNSDFGLGVVVAGKKKNLYFWKGGHNLGYQSMAMMFPEQGKGIVVMTNSETGELLKNYFIALVAKEYHWPYYFPFLDELIKVPE